MDKIVVAPYLEAFASNVNLSEYFTPVVKGEYANRGVVFSAPVNREIAMLNAIKSLNTKQSNN